MALEIEIRGPGGLVLTLTGETSWSVLDVKQKVESEKGIATHVQALSAGTRKLCDIDLLSSIVYDGSQLSLTLHRRTADQTHWLKLLESQDGPGRLGQAPDAIRSDFELMLVAVGRDPATLKHAHQKLLGSSDFIFAAARRNPDALHYAAKALWTQPDFVLEALTYSWRWLDNMSDQLRSDRAFILRATAINRWALQCASDDVRADKDFEKLCLTGGRRQYIMDLMRDNGRSLCRAHDLKNDPEIVTTAVNSNGSALEYAAPELQADRAIVMQAINNDPMALQWAAPELKCDRNVLVAALEKDTRAVEWVPRELMADQFLKAYNISKRPPLGRKGGTAICRPSSSVTLTKAGVTELPAGRNSRRPRRPASATGARRTRPLNPH